MGTTRELAALVVDVLEIGTGKEEDDVVGLCRDLGVDYDAVKRKFPLWRPHAKATMRSALVDAIAAAAGTQEEIINRVGQIGARFLEMIKEIYELLAQHKATTRGTSAEFRFRRNGVIVDLPISPAFIERVRSLQSRLVAVEQGTIDDELLKRFIGSDGGEFYGTWPPRESSFPNRRPERFPLARALTLLVWVKRSILTRAHEPAWENVRKRLKEAESAAEGFIETALWLVRASAAAPTEEWRLESGPGTRGRRSVRMFVGPYYKQVERSGVVAFAVDELLGTPNGLASSPGIARIHDEELEESSGIELLGCLCGLWKVGFELNAGRSLRSDLEAWFESENTESIATWLAHLAESARGASDWLRKVVWTPTGTMTHREWLDAFEEYLNLPLWRERSLLFEIWVLCHVLADLEDSGWKYEVALERESGVWILPDKRAELPVARLYYEGSPETCAHLWREPLRRTPHGEMTPDISISAGPCNRDLVVIECKDRYEMAMGLPAKVMSVLTGAASGKKRTALDVGNRYRMGLVPAVTWVVNYCEFEGTTDPTRNFGDPWSAIFLGSAFRPGYVPDGFKRTLVQALLPLEKRIEIPQEPGTELVLVTDTTASMHSNLESLWPLLTMPRVATALDQVFDVFRAMLFADHGPQEPYLVREVGPFRNVKDLVEAIRAQPLSEGGDTPEAIEDAVRACRLIAEENRRRMCVLMITDAPPHPQDECPHSCDFDQEITQLLALGHSIFVIDSWLKEAARHSWAPHLAHERLRLIDVMGLDGVGSVFLSQSSVDTSRRRSLDRKVSSNVKSSPGSI